MIFLRLSGFLDLFDKIYLIAFKLSLFMPLTTFFLQEQCLISLISLFIMQRKIITVITITLFIKKKTGINFVLSSRSRKMIGWFMKFISINQSRFYNFSNVRISKMLNITSKYFCILNNKSPASRVAHIRYSFTSYSCSFHVYSKYIVVVLA